MRHQNFDLLSIRLFLAASHLGSFTGAARAMNLVPSAVSRRLTEIEEEIGVALFMRLPNGVALTASGLEVQRQFATFVASYEKMWFALGDLSGGARGMVRVWATSTSLTRYFSERLKRFLDAHEGIRVEIEERTDLQVVQAVAQGKADVGFCSSHQDVRGLQQIPFAQDRIVLVAPPEHVLVKHKSVAFTDIARHDLVGWDEGVALGALLQSLAAAADTTLRIRLQVRSLGALCSMVKAGLGIAVAPHPRVIGEATEFGLATVPISENWAMRHIQLVHRGDEVMSPAARLLAGSMVAT